MNKKNSNKMNDNDGGGGGGGGGGDEGGTQESGREKLIPHPLNQCGRLDPPARRLTSRPQQTHTHTHTSTHRMLRFESFDRKR